MPCLLALAQMEVDLADMLKRQGDLRTPFELSRDFRDEVISTARPLHAA